MCVCPCACVCARVWVCESASVIRGGMITLALSHIQTHAHQHVRSHTHTHIGGIVIKKKTASKARHCFSAIIGVRERDPIKPPEILFFGKMQKYTRILIDRF